MEIIFLRIFQNIEIEYWLLWSFKINFNKNENELSFNKNVTNNNPFSEVLEKNISVDLLKQIIEARVNEIIELSVFQSDYVKQNKTLQELHNFYRNGLNYYPNTIILT